MQAASSAPTAQDDLEQGEVREGLNMVEVAEGDSICKTQAVGGNSKNEHTVRISSALNSCLGKTKKSIGLTG